MYDFPIYKSAPYLYTRQRGRGVGTIIKKAAPIVKRVIRSMGPKLGRVVKKIVKPVLKKQGKKAIKRMIAGENLKTVMKEAANSSAKGLKRKAMDEFVEAVTPKKSKKRNTMRGLFEPNAPIKGRKPRRVKNKKNSQELRRNLLKKLLKKKLS